MPNITNYLKETKAEMKHVNWPSRKQSVLFTALVIVISLSTAAYLGILDFVFAEILKIFL